MTITLGDLISSPILQEKKVEGRPSIWFINKEFEVQVRRKPIAKIKLYKPASEFDIELFTSYHHIRPVFTTTWDQKCEIFYLQRVKLREVPTDDNLIITD